MNKVVTRQHVRASELPADLRGEIPPSALVTVTVSEEVTHDDRKDPIQLLKEYHQISDKPGVTSEEAVQRVRALRDEWDD
ncbi:hypothetical protein [Chthonobacter albigriseus]|uniref:hypothetical protein n=1 Tax=Chthonobacter albigriseus TaxID=1683161 RepID=UPI0015EEA7BF|nr:hypothetical protein [Chthonobacter albigriseus]